MQGRFLKSSYVLATVALAWVAGIVLLHYAYLRPSLDKQLKQAGQDEAAGWMRLANTFLRTYRQDMVQASRDWAHETGLGGDLSSFERAAAESVPVDLLRRHRIGGIVLCDGQGRTVSSWRVQREGGLAREERLPAGTDLGGLPIFNQALGAAEFSGISQTPLGLALFSRIRAGEAGYVVAIRAADEQLFAEVSAMAGAGVRYEAEFGAGDHGHGEAVGEMLWTEQDRVLTCAQVLRDSAGRAVGYLVAEGRLLSSFQQYRTVKQALVVTVLWAGGFALLMILVIHVLVSGPTASLWGRIQLMRTGQRVKDLPGGLRCEAWALAKEFEKVICNVEKLSETDSLTNLANRRSFQQLFHQEFRRARRYGRPLALATIDIDFFKAVNDALGHQAGDQALKVFAEAITESVRSSDNVARLGGDEFAILMPETTGDQACVVAERIRQSLSQKSIGRGVLKMALTASIGIVDMNAEGADTPESMFDLADKALYAAKHAGRNRLVRAEECEQVTEAANAPDQNKVDHLARQLAGLDAKFKRLFVEAIGGLISALEMRDVHTANHAAKVRRYATLIARQMEMPEHAIEHIARAAMLHDIGKIGLPDTVLLKEGRLSDEEWELVRGHPVSSVRIMQGMEFLDQEIPAVRYHHEHYDGSGYPEGLAGSSIPLSARILCVADAFDAMTSTRAYRNRKTVEEALAELTRGSGTHFDPAVVEAFMRAVEQIPDEDELVALAAPA